MDDERRKLGNGSTTSTAAIGRSEAHVDHGWTSSFDTWQQVILIFRDGRA